MKGTDKQIAYAEQTGAVAQGRATIAQVVAEGRALIAAERGIAPDDILDRAGEIIDAIERWDACDHAGFWLDVRDDRADKVLARIIEIAQGGGRMQLPWLLRYSLQHYVNIRPPA